MVSTHFAEPHRPSERELRLMDLLARQAADYLERKDAENTRQLPVRELNHRVKNTLAIVQATAQQTMRSTKDPADFAKRINGRLRSLARVHSLLTESTWQGADLSQLIRDQLLQGSIDEERLTAWGPVVHVAPQTALHTGIILHELATNSLKYGALSAPRGWIAIRWSVTGNTLDVQWVERGGPAVSAPVKRGFGTTLVEQSAKSEGGKAEQVFESEGITWKISVSLPQFDRREEATLIEPPSAAAVTTQKSAGIATKASAQLAGRRLLVIEDESFLALDLVDMLELAGAAIVRAVGTEEEALQMIKAEDFDCALLDGNLHGRPVTSIAAA
jgi:two-component sensor histidine kinase